MSTSLPPLLESTSSSGSRMSQYSKMRMMIHKKSKQVQEKNVELKSKMSAINLLKDKASYRTDRELDLAHFKSLLTIFKVNIFSEIDKLE